MLSVHLFVFHLCFCPFVVKGWLRYVTMASPELLVLQRICRRIFTYSVLLSVLLDMHNISLEVDNTR